MLQALAYSPSHVTGFFEILDAGTHKERQGSRGAGVSLEKGVRTKVSLRRRSRPRISIRVNGEPTSQAKVSAYVARRYLDLAGENFSIAINHAFEVPIGTGFGTSGAGALSLSLALNDVLELDLPFMEASQIAHEAEIVSKTGLGTVIAEAFGGMEVRLRPGAPGLGRIVEIPFGRDEAVFAVSFGPLSTTHVLSTPWMRQRINGHARELLWNLMDDPSPTRLIQLSREFSNGIGLATHRVRSLLSLFDSMEIPASMLMMGDGVFSILPHSDVERVAASIGEKMPHAPFLVTSSIAPSGARVLDS